MILVDTSALVGSLCGTRAAAPHLRRFIADGIRIAASSLVLYEWWRGPRLPDELRDQEALFPRAQAFPFGIAEAALSADLYRKVKRARGRELDLAIAAVAIANGAALWTLNRRDFRDIPGLELA
jgi:predicted nucleic acid-binding protein